MALHDMNDMNGMNGMNGQPRKLDVQAKASSATHRKLGADVDTVAKAHNGLRRSLMDVNQSFMAMRNIIGVLKFPALITAVGAATQVGRACLELEIEVAAGAVAVVVGELHLQVDAVVFVGADLLPLLVGTGEAGAHFEHQQLAFAAAGELGGFGAKRFNLATQDGIGEQAL